MCNYPQKQSKKLKIKITGTEHTYQLGEGSTTAVYHSAAILGTQLHLPV